MPNFVVPTVFTAIDNYSRNVGIMGKVTDAFNGSITNAAKRLIAFGEAGAIIAGVTLSAKSIMDYEAELQNLKALTGVTGSEFTKFKETITSVAKETRKSSVEVAGAFTTIANAMPELLQNASGLGDVTRASIMLAKAARMELTPAAESVTTILNQFGKGAESAASLVDMMAAGSKYGSAEISDLAASMTEFGAQAKLAGISLKESIGLTELVSKFRKGAQAGTELRNVMLYMETLKVQDPKAIADLNRLGVNMSLVANKAIPVADRFLELKKIVGDDAALFHVFGKENMSMAANILTNAEALKPLVSNIGESGNAARMAADNTDTLSQKLEQLQATWVTNITTSDKATFGINKAKKAVGFLTDNMDLLLGVTVSAIQVYLLWKASVLTARGVMFGYNVITGLAAGFTSNLTGALSENVTAFKAETAAIEARNFAMKGGLFFTLLAISSYKALNDQIDDNAKRKMANPLGLDFNKSAADNKDILSKYRVPESQFNAWKQKYIEEQGRIYHTTNMDASRNPVGIGILKLFGDAPNAMSHMPVQSENVDSTRNAVDAMYNNLGKGGDMGNGVKNQLDSLQKIQLEITTPNGTNVNLKNNSGGAEIKLTKTGGAQ